MLEIEHLLGPISSYVLDTEPWFYGESAYGWATEDVLRKAYAHEILEREKILAKIKEKAEKINIQPKTEVLMSPQTTSTAAAIMNYAEKEGVDLITIGTRGRTGIRRMLLGSVASAVVPLPNGYKIVVVFTGFRMIAANAPQVNRKLISISTPPPYELSFWFLEEM